MDIATALNQNILPPLEITPEDKENFLKSVLTDKPYSEVISLFDGKHKIAFRSMKVQEHYDIESQVQLDQKNGLYSELTNSIAGRIKSYILGVSIIAIDSIPFQPDIDASTFPVNKETDSYIARRAEVFATWDKAKLRFYIDAYNRFDEKVTELSTKVRDQDFWKANK